MPRYRRDLTPGSTWFFTVALADRRATTLVERIARLRAAYRRVWRAHPFATEAICVLPDHLHAMWTLPAHDRDYATRWRLIKAFFSRALAADPDRGASKRRRREKGIWQRRYWEHRIRDEQDWARHVEYIHFNPVKHGHTQHVHEWPYSSFHRWVEQGRIEADWGSGIVLPDLPRSEP